MEQVRASSIVRFGNFELDLRARELRKNGLSTGLPEQSIKILSMLLENAGDVVLREEIRRALWPDNTIVEFDHSINAAVKRLRHALGDSVGRPRYIETLARRGYRWKSAVELNPGNSDQHFPILAAAVEALQADSERTDGAAAQTPEALVSSELTSARGPGVSRWLAAMVSAVAIVVVVLWLTLRHSPLSASAESKQRQITNSLADDAPRSGSISPDGKYLAYADPKGIHVKRFGVDEITQVTPPELQGVDWYLGPWFPDSSRFIANARPAGTLPVDANSKDTSIWIVSRNGDSPRKLRDNANAYSITPDGSFVSFGTGLGKFGDREVWLITPDGNHLHKLYEAGEESSFASLTWSPDGQRTAYVQIDKGGPTLRTRDAHGGPAATLPVSVQANGIFDTLWLPDGRLLYSQGDLGAGWGTCNLWSMRIDSRSGKVLEKARRMTSWVGSCLVGLSATADGDRVVFNKWMFRLSVNVADLENSTHLSAPRPFARSDSSDYPATWTADSRALLLWSNREGRLGIYKQDLDGGPAVNLVSGSSSAGFPEVSPDGSWVFFDEPALSANPTSLIRKMRVPITGGPPEVIAMLPPDAQLLCAKMSSSACVLKAPSKDRKSAVFAGFDPAAGRGAEFLRLDVSSLTYFGWDLSPDGKRIVICRSPQGPLQLFSLSGQSLGTILVPALSNMKSLDWAANSDGFYIANAAANGVILYHVDLNGNAVELWRQPGSMSTYAKASPDGRHIALLALTHEANLWTLEDF